MEWGATAEARGVSRYNKILYKNQSLRHLVTVLLLLYCVQLQSGALVCYVCFGKEDQLWITHISILSPIFIHSHNYFRRVALAQPAREISAVELDKLRCFDSAIEPHSRVFFFFFRSPVSITWAQALGALLHFAVLISDYSLRFASLQQNRTEKNPPNSFLNPPLLKPSGTLIFLPFKDPQ